MIIGKVDQNMMHIFPALQHSYNILHTVHDLSCYQVSSLCGVDSVMFIKLVLSVFTKWTNQIKTVTNQLQGLHKRRFIYIKKDKDIKN